MLKTPHLLFRTVAVAEAVSWTLLIGGMVLRATAGLDVAVSIGGGVHGFVFLAYVATALLVAKNQRLGGGPTAVALISSVVPYATIPADIWLTRTGRLAGGWRRNATGDPRDHRWHDRLFRSAINRPLISCAIVAVGVAVVFLALLSLGPPLGDHQA